MVDEITWNRIAIFFHSIVPSHIIYTYEHLHDLQTHRIF